MKKKAILPILSLAIVAFTIGSVTTFKGKINNLAYVFDKEITANDSVEVTPNQNLPQNIDLSDNKNGIKLSTKKNGASVSFANREGNFDLRFRIFSEENTRDFDNMIFEYSEVNNARAKFEIAFINGETREDKSNLRVKYKDVPRYFNIENVGFDNSGEILGVSFNPKTMQTAVFSGENKTNLIDFDSLADMSTFSSSVAEKAYIRYNLKITFSGIKSGKSANVLLYSMNGQSLANETYVNNAGPTLNGEPKLNNGLVNKEYVFDTNGLTMYDVIDGKSNFDGKIEVIDPENLNVKISGNKFTPTKYGTYKAIFTAKDKNNLFGESITKSFIVYKSNNGIGFDYELPFNNMVVGSGTNIVLPKVSANTKLVNKDSKLAVDLLIKYNGEIEKSFINITEKVDYNFSKVGNYTVIYQAVDMYGTKATEEYSVTTLDMPKIETQSINSIYRIGEEFILPTAKVAGATVNTTIISSDGKESSYPKVTIDRMGIWQVRYDYSLNNKNYNYSQYFKAIETADNLWVCERGMNVASNVRTPNYYDIDTSGVELTGALTSSKATYKNVINLANKTKNDTLIEFLVTPKKVDVLEIQELDLVLTDVHNANNNITITLQKNVWGYKSLTNVIVKASNGAYVENILNTTFFGKFLGGKISTDPINYDPSITRPFTFAFDYKENALYASPLRGTDTLDKVVDFDDINFVGAGNEWKGFTNGEIKLSLVYKNINDTAHIIVTEVDGVKLSSSSVVDNIAPYITIDYDKEMLPNAKVNQPYKIFDAKCGDSIDSKVSGITKEVYFNDNGVFTQINLLDGNTFIPTNAGEYKVVYIAKDISGNIGRKTMLFQAFDSLEEISLASNLDDIYPSDLNVGEKLRFVNIEAVGGSGKLNVEYKIFKGENELTLNDNAIIFEESGEYTIKYIVSDYIGQRKEFIKKITIKSNNKPIFSATTIPSSVLKGKKFVIPTVTAKDYSTELPQNAVVTAYIDGVIKNMGESFIPQSNFTLKYTATSKANETSELIYIIDVLQPQANANYILDHFELGDNITATSKQTELNFATTTNGANFKFVNKLPSEQFGLKFNFNPTKLNFNQFNLTFTDSQNSHEKIVVSIQKNSDKNANFSFISVNGGELKQFAGSFYAVSGEGMELRLEGNKIYDISNKLVYTITNTIDGDSFDSFSSKFVYVQFSFGFVTGNAEVNITNICNQVLNAGNSDRIKPMILKEGSIPPSANFMSTVQLPKVYSVDVLDPYVSFKLTIVAPDGSVIYEGSVDGISSLKLESYGVYSFAYEARDSAKRVANLYSSINVLNLTPPQITINGEVSLIGKVNEVYNVASASVSENITLRIYVIYPSGVRQLVTDNKFTPTLKGNYKLMYYAFNSDNTSKLLSYDIVVA